VLEDGLAFGLHRIEWLMRKNALRARRTRRWKLKEDCERSIITSNVFDGDFEADRPNQKWFADFTKNWTSGGWLCVVFVLALVSMRVVGWSMKADQDASLALDARMMAV
jgi:putative transposase